MNYAVYIRTMNRNAHIISLIAVFSVLQGCSVQKRTLLPGYHIEMTGKASSPQVFDDAFASIDHMESKLVSEWDMMRVQDFDEEYSLQLSESDIQSRSQRLIKMNRISPHANGSTRAPRALQLADPKPWDAAYKSQKTAGNLALISLCASILFIVAGVSNPMVVVVLLLTTLVALVVNRRKRKEVLDIQELEGIDVQEKRRNFRNTNKLIGGTVAFGAALITVFIISVIAAIASIFSSF